MKKFFFRLCVFLSFLITPISLFAQVFKGNSTLELRVVELSSDLSDSPSNLKDYRWELNLYLNNELITESTYFGKDDFGGNSNLTSANAQSIYDGDKDLNAVATQSLPHTFFSNTYSESFPTFDLHLRVYDKVCRYDVRPNGNGDDVTYIPNCINNSGVNEPASNDVLILDEKIIDINFEPDNVLSYPGTWIRQEESIVTGDFKVVLEWRWTPPVPSQVQMIGDATPASSYCLGDTYSLETDNLGPTEADYAYGGTDYYPNVKYHWYRNKDDERYLSCSNCQWLLDESAAGDPTTGCGVYSLGIDPGDGDVHDKKVLEGQSRELFFNPTGPTSITFASIGETGLGKDEGPTGSDPYADSECPQTATPPDGRYDCFYWSCDEEMLRKFRKFQVTETNQITVTVTEEHDSITQYVYAVEAIVVDGTDTIRSVSRSTDATAGIFNELPPPVSIDFTADASATSVLSEADTSYTDVNEQVVLYHNKTYGSEEGSVEIHGFSHIATNATISLRDQTRGLTRSVTFYSGVESSNESITLEKPYLTLPEDLGYNVSEGETPWTGLQAGDYTLQIQTTYINTEFGTAKGISTVCDPQTIDFTILQPEAALAITNVDRTWSNGKHLKCRDDNTGRIRVTISGGVGPYTVLLKSGDGTISSTRTPSVAGNIDFNGLPAKYYTISVTDVFGNTEQTSTTLTQPLMLSLTSVKVSKESGVPTGSAYDVKCHDGLAGIEVKASGGNTSANRVRLYSGTGTWLAGEDIASGTYNFTDLSAADYQVQVADAYGYCQTALQDVSIVAPTALSTTYNVPEYALNGKNIRCFGAKDGRIIAQVLTGGVAPYTVQLSAPNTTLATSSIALSTTGAATFSGLGRYQDDGVSVASYTITITDANNCVKTHSGITLTEPEELVVGTPLKTYLEDATFSHALYDVPCFDNTVQVTLPVTGGNRSLTVSLRLQSTNAIIDQVTLADGQNLASFSNVGAGTYVLTVKDALVACGTVTTDAFTVTIPDEIDFTRWTPLWDDYHISCKGEIDGRVFFNVNAGGLAPYTLIATKSSIDYTKEISTTGFGSVTGLAPGTYSIRVEDELGCVATKTNVTLTEPPTQYLIPTVVSPNNAIANYEITCFGDLSTATITSIGGNLPHVIALSKNGTNYTSASFSLSGDTTFTVFENLPADNLNQYQVSMQASDAACGATGSFWIRGPSAAISTTIERLTYTSGVHVKCPGDNTGRIKVSPSGGLAPYTARLYADGLKLAESTIANGGSYTFSNLYATSGGADIVYSIAVEDKLGCIDTVTQVAGGGAITLREPEQLVLSTSLPPTIEGYHLYCATSTGYIQVQTSGGVFNHAIRFYDSANNQVGFRQTTTSTDQRVLGALSAGRYTIKLTDAINGTGCEVWDTVELLQPDPLSISIDTIIAPSCLGSDDGQISLSAKAGIPFTGGNYNFELYRKGTAILIDSGTGSAVTLSAAAGTYVAKVYDQGNCVAQTDVTVTDRAPLYVYFNTTNTKSPTCYDKADGRLFAVGADGTPTSAGKYTWRLFSDAAKTNQLGVRFNDKASFANLASGQYFIEIEDSLGCTYDIDTTLINPDPLSIDLISLDRPTCHEGADAQITVRGSGGTGSFYYSDDNTTFTTVATSGAYQRKDLLAGTYYFYLRDTNYNPATPAYCFAADTLTIQDRGPIEISLDVQEVTCYDDKDGQVLTEVVQEGSSIASRLAYAWYSGASLVSTDQDLSGADAGTYHLLITDTTNLCTAASDTVTIIQPAALVLAASRSFPTTCSSDDDGKIIVSATGGSPAYTYWLNGTLSNSLQIFAGLPAAIHQVTVVDTRGCSDTVMVEVEKGALKMVADSVADATCYGAADGYVSLVVSNEGGASYEYSADNGSTWQSASIFRLAAGDYQFLARETYADPCYSAILNITIDEPDPLTALASLVQDAACGQSDGGAEVTVGGGSGTYTITWFDADLQEVDPEALAAGTYVVEVLDPLSLQRCSITDTIEVGNIPAPGLDYTETATPYCAQAIGSIELSASGGTGAYTYQLAGRDPQTSTTIDALSAGTSYTVIVTDERGCTDALSFSLTDGPELQVSTVSVTDANCTLSDGALEVTAAGGVAPYTYTWPDSVSTDDTAVLTGLASGLYTVTVTDAAGCETTHPVAVSDLNGPGLSITTTQSWCSLPTGTAEAVVSGGTGVITYTWSGPDGFSAATASLDSLATGTYGLIIEDELNCQVVATTTITEDASLSPALSLIADSASACGLSLGRAEVEMTGGEAPYTYAWYDESDALLSYTTAIAENLSSGDYTVLATDARGCSESLSLSITELASPTLSFVARTTATCGEAVGTAEVKASGGTGAYTYVWNDPATQTTAFAENLAAGSYSVYAQDGNGCQTNTLKVTILSDPALLVQQNQVTAAGCAGAADGSATIIAAGGTAPYSYRWDDPVAQSTATASGLDAGDYTVTVTDAKGCTSALSLTVPERSPLVISESYSSLPSCYGDADGALGVLAEGGTEDFAYAWSTGSTGDQISAIVAGDYTVTVSDKNTGCSIAQTLSLGQPDSLYIASSQVLQPFCEGDCNGRLQVTAAGGTGKYNYAWSQGSTRAFAGGLCAGDYTLTVTDANGCPASVSLALTDPAPITLAAWQSTLPSCSDDCNGSMQISVDNSTSPVLFLWSNGAFGSRASNLCAGNYTVEVLDANGCEASFSNELRAYPPLQLDSVSTTDLACADYCNGSIRVYASGGNGTLSYRWSHGATGSSLSNLCAGTYTVTIRDQSGCSIRQRVTLTEPEVLSLSVSQQKNPTCAEGNDGLIELAATGGTGTYTYSWGHGASGASLNDLTAGYYSAYVTDGNGCEAMTTASLRSPYKVTATATTQYPSCASACDGSISLSAKGGTGAYTFTWEDGTEAASRSGLCQGSYAITVADANGCDYQLSEELISPDRLQIIDMELIDPLCAGNCNGSISLAVTGGTAPYSYDWEHGADAATASGLCAGTYAVIVSDAAGCIDSARTSLIDPDPVSIAGVDSAYTICEGEILRIDAGLWGSYQWSATAIGYSSINREAVILAAGEYSLQVKSFAGCAASTSFSVDVTSDPFDAEFLMASASEVGDTVEIIDVTLPEPERIMWDLPLGVTQLDGGADRVYLIFNEPGTYTIGFTGSSGDCSTYLEKEITIYEAGTLTELAEEAAASNKLEEIELTAYPNPSRGLFSIRVELESPGAIALEVLDLIQGRQIARYQDEGDFYYRKEFDLSALPSGVYMIRLSAKGQQKIIRITKQ